MTDTSLPPAASLPSPRIVKVGAGALALVVLAILAITKVMQVIGHIEEGKKKGPPPTTVSTLVAQSAEWTPSLSLVGSLSAVEGAMLSAETAGIVARIHVDKPGIVEAGTLLVELDTTVEQAELAAAEARTWEAKKTLDRAAFLAPRQASSRSELDQAEATFRARKAEAAAIEAKIARKQIRSPFRGQLGIRQVNLGAYVSPGTPIIPLYQLDTIHADFAVPQDRVADIKIGQSVSLTTTERPETPISGSITAIDPQIDPTSRLLSVRATFANGDQRLRPGMFATVQITLGANIPVIPVPEPAIAFAPYGNSIYVLKGEPTGTPPSAELEQRFVTLGERRGDLIAVLSGLKPGDRFVSAGTFRLRPGMGVNIDDSIQPGVEQKPQPPRT